MENKKEKTTPCVSVGADTEQSIQKCTNDNIPKDDDKFNSFEEIQKMLDLSYLKTISMTDLYDKVFESGTDLIEGMLYRGAYLFVGSPKIGKSFMMLQLAYHISMEKPLWDYKVRQAPVLYLALEDNYTRLQRRLYKMFGTEETELWVEPPEPLLEKISEICFSESNSWIGTATELCEKLMLCIYLRQTILQNYD